MADRVKPGPVDHAATVREAVSVHTKKIYDSCRDKDCLEDLRLYPDAASQAAITSAIGIRAKSVELLHAPSAARPRTSASPSRRRHSTEVITP